MAVWICLNFTKPRPATNRSVTVSITNIRLAMNYSSSTNRHASAPDVQEHAAVDAMPVARLLAEERRRVVFRLQRDEAVVAAQSPAAGVPVDAAPDVAREKRLRVEDAERLLLEHARAADAARDVGHDRRPVRRGDHQVAAVVEKVRRLEVRRATGQREALRDAERAADFTLDADEPVEVDRDAGAESVVAEARPLCVGALREERRAAGNDRDHDGSGSRGCRLLRVCLRRARHTDDREQY